MDYQTIEGWRMAFPFEPFRVVLADGREFAIPHPNLIWPGRSTVVIGVQDLHGAPGVFGHYISAAMIHIVRLEPIATSPSTP
jgi:hypothetical protein